MGMTPLAGVMMGTRTGDFDPAIFGYLLDKTGMTREARRINSPQSRVQVWVVPTNEELQIAMETCELLKNDSPQ